MLAQRRTQRIMLDERRFDGDVESCLGAHVVSLRRIELEDARTERDEKRAKESSGA